jgi:thioredoxin reductase (NADPH)
MTADREGSAESVAGAPVLVIVDADQHARAVTESALVRRFAPDYRVLTAASAEAGLDTLARLAQTGDDVALLAADLHLPGMGGIEFLQRAHRLHRGASRVLLVPMDRHHTRIPFSELETLRRATALGQIDTAVAKGWVTPEEWLYPQVQEALTGWTVAHRPRHLVYRIVGEQWAQRSHDLRDFLTRNGVPFEFHPADSDPGRQLLREYRVDTARLPAVIHHSGSVLHDPRDRRRARHHDPTPVSNRRPGDSRLRTGRPGGRGVRRVGRPADRGRRAGGDRRSGRNEFPDP